MSTEINLFHFAKLNIIFELSNKKDEKYKKNIVAYMFVFCNLIGNVYF